MNVRRNALLDSQYKINIHQTYSTRGFESFIGGIHSHVHQLQTHITKKTLQGKTILIVLKPFNDKLL